MIYVDTSLLVSLHVTEPHSVQALKWFASHAQETFCYSDWSDLEFASALSRKMRMRKLESYERSRAEQAFADSKAEAFQHVAMTSEHFRIATSMVAQHQTGLRSGDALHLAIAQGYGATIATLDDIMALAAAQFGVPVERPA